MVVAVAVVAGAERVGSLVGCAVQAVIAIRALTARMSIFFTPPARVSRGDG